MMQGPFKYLSRGVPVMLGHAPSSLLCVAVLECVRASLRGVSFSFCPLFFLERLSSGGEYLISKLETLVSSFHMRGGKCSGDIPRSEK